MGLHADPSPLWYCQCAHVRRRSSPAALHIVGPDFQVLVRISDLAVIEGEARAGQVAEAMEWARANR